MGCKKPAWVDILQASCLRNVAFLWAIFCTFHSGRAQEGLEVYSQGIKPLLENRCYSCHGALKQEAGLRLDTAESIKKGGDSGSILDLGVPSESLLLKKLQSTDQAERMPPEGKPLSPAEIELILRWIEKKAPAPKEEKPQKDPRDHWAYRLPVQWTLPKVDSGSTNPIDIWIESDLAKQGLKPTSEASRTELLRRLYLDLVGLPPPSHAVREFLDDPSVNAYEMVVEQLLASPLYGERWGRHWMDVWRYSDWYGRRSVPDVMNSYPQIWRWRDWIIRSLNQDKGYDRMILEMLAADERIPDDDENLVATGFIVRNWYKWNYETWMKDNVEHTAKAFLGLTMNCAFCHDHKYDPISHEDYFRFRAFFEPLELRHDRVAAFADPGPFQKYVYAKSYGPIASGAIRVFDEKLDAKTYMFTNGDARNRIEGRPPVDPSPPRSLLQTPFEVQTVNLPVEAYYPGRKKFIIQEERQKSLLELQNAIESHAKAEKSRLRLDDEWSRLRTSGSKGEYEEFERRRINEVAEVQNTFSAVEVARAKLHSLECRIAADEARYNKDPKVEEIAIAASAAEKQYALEGARHSVRVAEQGLIDAKRKEAGSATDPKKLEEAKKGIEKAQQSVKASQQSLETALAKSLVRDSQYTPLTPVYPSTSTGRRSALANWIAQPQNPLTARVAVNHVWLRHFGKALVATTDNFGVQGEQPTHPELLDWLAVEFMESGWSFKHLHRLMVTSAVYRRSSHASTEHEGRSKDQDNRWYWKFPVRRMEAEVVRDSVLSASGEIDLVMGGQELETGKWFSSTRRSLYFSSHGEAKMQFLDTFDGANVNECYRRSSTILPQQALAMINGELLVHNSRKLAAAIVKQYRDDHIPEAQWDDRLIDEVFLRMLGRLPKPAEHRASVAFLEDQKSFLNGLKEEDRVGKSAEGVQLPSKDAAQRARENLVLGLFSHNDFVTIR